MSEQKPPAPKPRIVPCPTCGGDSVFAPSNQWRPFCSERCRQIDLGAWASESFRVQAAPPSDDQDLVSRPSNSSAEPGEFFEN